MDSCLLKKERSLSQSELLTYRGTISWFGAVVVAADVGHKADEEVREGADDELVCVLGVECEVAEE